MKPQVLVPLDGSPLAESIIPHAVAMARMISGGITLLEATPMPVTIEPIAGALAPTISAWELWEEEENGAQSYLQDVAKLPQFKGVPVQYVVIENHAAEAIISYAQRPEIQLIAMATHGRTGLSRWVLGSVAQKVLHSAPKPLLLVRPASSTTTEVHNPTFQPEHTYRHILVPVDGSPFAEQALGWAKSLASAGQSRLTLVSAVRETPLIGFEERPGARWTDTALRAGVDKVGCYVHRLAEALKAEGLKVQNKIVNGPAAEAILDTSSKEHADLIVMATHGRSGLQSLWLGSIAMKVVQSSAVPVLLVRAHEVSEEQSQLDPDK